MSAGTSRRRLLAGAGSAGLAGLLAACSGADPEPAVTSTTTEPLVETPTPTQTESGVDPSYVPEGLDESQLTQYRYGDHGRQVSDLWMPVAEPRAGLVVLVHGGAYLDGIDRRDVNRLVTDLVGRGWPVLNADYRGVGGDGGWTNTFTDLASAVDSAARVVEEHSLPADRILVLGHSAGGHLAMWSAARRNVPAGGPGADPVVVPAFAGSMSGVLHPTALGTVDGDPNVVNVMGGLAADVDQHYALVDPTRLVPLGMPLFVLHGTADDTVPVWQSQDFAAAATAAGDAVQLELTEGGGHGDPLDTDGPMWATARGWIEASLG